MAGELQGKTIAFLATDGVEQIEYTEPRKAVEQAGGTATWCRSSPARSRASTTSTRATSSRSTRPSPRPAWPSTTGWCCPAGSPTRTSCATTPTPLPSCARSSRPASRSPRSAGAWTLVEAGVVKGRTLTSWPSIRTDVENAGSTWVDEEVHTDRGLVTSRKPDDLPAFNAKLVEEFAEGVHDEQAQATTGPERSGDGATDRGPRRRRHPGRHQLPSRHRLVPRVPRAWPDPAGVADPSSHRHGRRPAGGRGGRQAGRGPAGRQHPGGRDRPVRRPDR